MIGTDAEEHVIHSIVYSADSDTTTLTLHGRLRFTHLGEVVTVPGDDRGHQLDMRAEVSAGKECSPSDPAVCPRLDKRLVLAAAQIRQVSCDPVLLTSTYDMQQYKHSNSCQAGVYLPGPGL